MKTKRNLSGIWFFRELEDNSKETVCFEDLEADEQIDILEKLGPENKIALIKQLSDTLNDIGERFDMIKK